MEQIDSTTYKVMAGENITLTIVAHKVDEKVAVAFGLQGAIGPDPHDPQIYKFRITSSPMSQFADIECEFAAVDPDSAFFQLFVQGDHGGGKFIGPSIRKLDGDNNTNLQFTIA